MKSLKSTWGEENSTFVAAGDLIGASTFESFVQKDKPTLEALNAAGLEFSAVGNHEFDQGYQDLINRVMKPTTRRPTRTAPRRPTGSTSARTSSTTATRRGGPLEDGKPIVMPTAVKDFGDGIKIGFVGAVTEDLMCWSTRPGWTGSR